jgi:hypothetical protein
MPPFGFDRKEPGIMYDMISSVKNSLKSCELYKQLANLLPGHEPNSLKKFQKKIIVVEYFENTSEYLNLYAFLIIVYEILS